MNPERRQRVNDLYSEALRRDRPARSAFLSAACAGDAALYRDVESLLAADENTRTLLLGADSVSAAEIESDDDAMLQPVAPGRHAGHYCFLSRIGSGGMGEVWLAEDLMLYRKVAIKLMRPRFTRNAESWTRFMGEARAASGLNHPNIITIYEIGQADSFQFIATEFIDGITLRERLSQGQIELTDTLGIIQQVVSALDTAHRSGIVHRDIKPENIMIRPDGLVKVLDFGLARVIARLQDADADQVRTVPGIIIGTIAYMSPEQARGLEVDARSDVFSLAIVLYEMITGRQPFRGTTPIDVTVAIINQPPPPVARYAPGAPEQLQAIFDKALQKDPDARYPSVREFGADLERVGRAIAASEAGPSHHIEPASEPLPAGRSIRTRRIAAWLAVGAVVLTLTGLALYRFSAPLRSPLPEPKFTPLIGLAGTKDFPAFSPDETRIAFSWDGGKNAQVTPRDIYVKEVGAGEPLRLTTAPEDDILATWSPDGRHITFERVLSNRHDVYRIPATGGQEQKLAETAYGSSWSPDGGKLAVSGLETPFPRDDRVSLTQVLHDGVGIFLIDIETGQRTRLTAPPRSTFDELPVFSPDGRSLAFRRVYGLNEGDVYVVRVSDRVSKQLTFIRNRIFGLTWTADSREIVFVGVRSGTRGIWRVPATGGEVQRVPIPGENPASPVLSRSGTKLAWMESSSDSNIWRASGPGFNGRRELGKFGSITPFLAFPREDHSPEFSPDGNRIVFASGRSGGEDLWICDRDGRNLRQLTNRGGPTGTPHWSPDGRWIAFDSNTNGDSDVYVISPDGGPWRRLTHEASSDSQPVWSHDGRWIYFKSNRSGRNEIWKISAEGGPARPITQSGAFEGFESPDGTLFYFSKGRGVYGIWSIPADGGPERPVPELSEAGYWRSWGLLNEGIYFISKEPGPLQTIRFFNFATRRITPLLAVDKPALWWQAGLTISRDGRSLLFAQLDHSIDEIMMMENFR